MIIRISIEASSEEKHTHLRSNFYYLLKKLGFHIHLDRITIHNGKEQSLSYGIVESSWSCLTAIREKQPEVVFPGLLSFEGKVDELMKPFLS